MRWLLGAGRLIGGCRPKLNCGSIGPSHSTAAPAPMHPRQPLASKSSSWCCCTFRAPCTPPPHPNPNPPQTHTRARAHARKHTNKHHPPTHSPLQALGTPLKIKLPPGLKAKDHVVVELQFRTAPEASALQWLEPSQTAGGKRPYLFTQVGKAFQFILLSLFCVFDLYQWLEPAQTAGGQAVLPLHAGGMGMCVLSCNVIAVARGRGAGRKCPFPPSPATLRHAHSFP